MCETLIYYKVLILNLSNFTKNYKMALMKDKFANSVYITNRMLNHVEMYLTMSYVWFLCTIFVMLQKQIVKCTWLCWTWKLPKKCYPLDIFQPFKISANTTVTFGTYHDIFLIKELYFANHHTCINRQFNV